MNREPAEPHPQGASADMAWWVLLDASVFSDDPFDDLRDALIAHAHRNANAVLGGSPRGPATWGLYQASRAWGYRNFTGT